MGRYDLIGNIAIVKFDRNTGSSEKKKYAIDFLKRHKNVKTILEKSERFKGRLRTQKTKYIAGERSKNAVYRENNCIFRLNVDTCYFSSRLASERKEIAGFVRKGEKVLVLFGGVGAYAIVIGKLSKASSILSVELGKECSKFAKENVKSNKLKERVEILQGDARRVLKNINEKFDRIVMPRPNLKDSFLDIVFPKIARNGIIYYYGFYGVDEIDKLKKLILNEAEKAEKQIKIIRIKRAGEIGIRRFRYRADIKVLN